MYVTHNYKKQKIIEIIESIVEPKVIMNKNFAVPKYYL